LREIIHIRAPDANKKFAATRYSFATSDAIFAARRRATRHYKRSRTVPGRCDNSKERGFPPAEARELCGSRQGIDRRRVPVGWMLLWPPMNELRGFGYTHARQAMPETKDRFFREKAETFVSLKTATSNSKPIQDLQVGNKT
jgi:hypothetical protein